MSVYSRHTNKVQVITSPITGAAAVTPNDAADLPEITLALFVGVAGTLKLTMMDNSVVTYAAITAGRHHLRAKRVWATGTSATSMVAEY
jgi:hypothetical protein